MTSGVKEEAIGNKRNILDMRSILGMPTMQDNKCWEAYNPKGPG